METDMDMTCSTYTTKDFNLAAFLWCVKKDNKVAELDKVTVGQEQLPSRLVLYFNFKFPMSQEEVNKLVLDYYNGRCLVEPRALFSAQGRLKDLIRSYKN